MAELPLNSVEIVLVGTLQSGNVGSVARAMKNMGLRHLKLAGLQCTLDDQARWMATHAGDILDSAREYADLREAVADAQYVIGTTARDRRFRNLMAPVQMAEKVFGLVPANRVAIVFGREDSGLTNDELELCDDAVTIPAASEMTSLNVAQAVMVIAYELFNRAESWGPSAGAGKRATSGQQEEMYDHVRTLLVDIGFLNPHNPDIALGKIKRLLTRAGLTEKDVSLIRGVARQLQWYVDSTRGLKR
jgi:TrmH family RNA methyltransferase